MKNFIFIITTILSIFLIYIFVNSIYINKEQINYFLNKNNNKSGLPILKIISDKILNYIKNIHNLDTFTFIDFGSGEGEMIKKVYKFVKNSIGIEIDKNTANNSTIKFKNTNNIKIINSDMIDYIFKDTNTIFYLYEPLWLLNNNDALKIYSKVFNNLINTFKNSKNILFIIYCSGNKKKLDMKFFNNYNLILLNLVKINRGLPFIYNNLYFLKYNN